MELPISVFEDTRMNQIYQYMMKKYSKNISLKHLQY